MRGFLFCALLIACGSSDGGNTSSSSGGPVDGDAGPTVTGTPSVVLSVSVPARTFIVQGADARIPIDVTRDATVHGPVHIAAKSIAPGYTIDALELPEGTTHGEIHVSVAAATTQGPVDVALEASLGANTAQAQLPLFARGSAGAIDTTFATDAFAGLNVKFWLQVAVGTDGIYATVNRSPTTEVVALVKMDADGKRLKTNGLGVGQFIALIKGGGFYNAGNPFSSRLANNKLARFTNDLELDPSFNNGAPKLIDRASTVASSTFALRAVGDSAIVLTTHLSGDGTAPDDFYVSKFTSSGAPDKAYGSAGTCNLALTTGALGLADGPADSFFVFAGANNGTTLRVLGCTDTGQRVTSLGTSPDYVRDSATSEPFDGPNQFLPDGSSGYYGRSYTSGPDRASVQRIGANGTITSTGLSQTDPLRAMVFTVDAKNRLITAAGAGSRLAVRRSLPDGSADSSFVASENYGTSIPAGSTSAAPTTIAMQGDDRIIVAGRINNTVPFILRYWN